MHGKLFTLVKRLAQAERSFVLQQIYYQQDTSSSDSYLTNVLKNSALQTKVLPKIQSQAYYNLIEYLSRWYMKNLPSYTRRTVIQIQVLYEKMMFEEAHKLLLRHKKKATEQHNYKLLLDLLDWEEKLINTLSPQEHQQFNRLIEERNESLMHIFNTNQYHDLSTRLMILLRSGSVRTNEDTNTLKEIQAHPLLQHDSTAINIFSKMYYYNTKGGLCWFQNNFDEGMKNMQKLLELFEQHFTLFSDNLLSYIVSYQNYLMIAIHRQNHQLVEERLQFLEEQVARSIPMGYDFTLHNLKITVVINSIQNILSAKKYQEGLGIAQGMEKKLHALPPQHLEGQLVLAYYNIAYLYFINGAYNHALKTLNYLTQHFSVEIRTHLHVFAALMQLIIHYEKENHLLMHNLAMQTKKRLLKNMGLKKIEDVLLSTFQQRKQVASPETFRLALQQLKKNVGELEKEPENKKYLMSFCIHEWIESKLKGKTLIEVLTKV